MLEVCDWRDNELKINSKLVQDLLLQLDGCKSMEPDWIHFKILKELAEVILRPLNYFSNSLRNLKRSQVTGSWKTLSQFSRRARKKTLVITGLSVLLE